jgi:tetratricopeptide (TPR) repeat protein
MFRKNYLIGFLTIALFLIGSTAVFAQATAAVRGKIELTKADGTKEPVVGALVEVYRTDVKSTSPSAKTDKKGFFNFAGLPVGAQLVLVISAPGITPVIQGGIKAGMENVVIPVEAGDGKHYTEQEVRDALANPGGGGGQTELTADQKKAKEDYDKKVAEYNSKKQQIESQTVAVQKALDEGNAAYTSKNYDVAVAKYEEGFQANPDFVGSAPVLLNNKGAALKARAVQVYNDNVKSTDATAKAAALGKVRQDLADAADAYNKAWTIIKTAPATDIKDPKTNELNKLNSLNGAKDTFRLMALTEQVDTSKTDIAKALIAEYEAIEQDTAKKTEAQRYLGDIYRVVGDSENAITEYKKVLDINPSDPDALAGIGLSLVNMGYINNDKAKLQEGADILQKYIEIAPANHKYVADAKGLIESLKAEQNVTPQKGKTTTTKKKN